jgi:predicted molibdopterin-dependent oxidoreductase YjgC
MVPFNRWFHSTDGSIQPMVPFKETHPAVKYCRRMRTGRHQHRPLERLTQPLVRDDGVLRPASWNEALDRAAIGLGRALDDRGGTSIGMFSCSKSTNEMNFIAQKLARAALSTNNIDSCNRT